MASTEENDKAKRGIKARQDAVRTLITNHQQEFDDLHVRNRVALGLPLRSSGPTREQRAEQIRKLQDKIDKWKKELDDLS